MTFSGLGMLVVLGGVIGLVVYAAITRGRMTVLHSIWAVLFGALGAYGGSELFGFVSESGPEANEETVKAELYQQIGEMKVELDWLKKRSGLSR